MTRYRVAVLMKVNSILIALFCILFAGCAAREFREHGPRGTADRTAGQSEICPKHQVKMARVRSKIIYGLIDPSGPWPSAQLRTIQFPFAENVEYGM